MTQLERLEAFMKNIDSVKTSNAGSGYEFFKAKDSEGVADPGTPLRILSPKYVAKGSVPLFEYEEYDLNELGLRRSVTSAHWFGAPDPIFDFHVNNINSTDPKIKKVAESLKPRRRWAALGFKPAEPGTLYAYKGITKTPALFITACAFKALKEGMYNWPFDLETGHNFMFKRTKENGFFKYITEIHPRNGPLFDPTKIDLKVMQEMVDNFDVWSKLLPVETEETLEEMLHGVYDKDIARERRKNRDDQFGRPYPDGKYGEGSDETKEVGKDELPFDPPYEKTGKVFNQPIVSGTSTKTSESVGTAVAIPSTPPATSSGGSIKDRLSRMKPAGG